MTLTTLETAPLSRRALYRATSRSTVPRVAPGLVGTSAEPVTPSDMLIRQNSTSTVSLSQQPNAVPDQEFGTSTAMLTTSVIDRTVAEIATRTVARLSALHVPQLERVACHRDGDWVTVWVICSEYPLQHADVIYALESDLVLEFPHVYVALQVVSRYGQDIATLADIPADSLSIPMAA